MNKIKQEKSIPTRLPTFDLMRVFAILGILLCHSCYEFSSPILQGFGKYLGMTFNFLFLAFSAFLLGFSWKKHKFPQYDKSYLFKRIVRLSRSYYPYLVVLFAFLYLSQDYFRWRHVFTHFLYLPWFDKIGGYGHLWFLTMIVICYIGSCMLTKLPLNISSNNWIFGIISIVGLSGAFLLNKLGLPGNLITYLLGFIFIYKNSTSIIERVIKIPIVWNLIQCITLNILIALLFIHGIYDISKFISGILGVISASSLFCLIFRAFQKIPQNRIIEYLACISFEIFLVHEFFLGRYSVYKYIDNPILGFILLIILSIICGAILHYISSLTKRWI